MAGASRDTIARISGPDSMAMPTPGTGGPASGAHSPERSTRPSSSAAAAASSSTAISSEPAAPLGKKKRHRGGKKRKKARKLSIIAPSEDTEMEHHQRPSLLNTTRESAQQANLERIGARRASNTSLESEALLDHRYNGPLRSRGYSTHQSYQRSSALRTPRLGDSGILRPNNSRGSRFANGPDEAVSDGEQDNPDANDRTPLLSHHRKASKPGLSRNNSQRNARRTSVQSKASSRRRFDMAASYGASEEQHDVNNPPSMPGSPTLGSYADPFFADIPSIISDRGRDAIIDIEGHGHRRYSDSPSKSFQRRPTAADLAGLDVCFPDNEESEYCEDDFEEKHHEHHDSPTRRRPRRNKQWPNFEILEDWVREEKEMRTEQEVLRAKKITEPVMFGGRLRPRTYTNWRADVDNSFRFAYFNECFDTTIHAQNISNLLDDGTYTFQDLFKPEFPDESDSSASEDEKEESIMGHRSPPVSVNRSLLTSNPPSGQETPKQPNGKAGGKRYGRRPTFWLDVRQPTPAEMQVLQDAFGIHRLTTEDIMTQDPRDKLELFQHYYFLNYRTFEQDKESENYMQPINLSMVVFQEGIISFHHSMIPHPNNVRRRIRQLRDYGAIPYADWISYALVDDVTDAYQPLVNQTELEVDEIDEEILYMHRTAVIDSTQTTPKKPKRRPKGWRSWRIWRWLRALFSLIWSILYFLFYIVYFVCFKAWKNIWDDLWASGEEEEDAADAGAGKMESAGDATGGSKGADMLRRVGETRKNVMTLYRLLGSKADVVKSFAKRCNEMSRIGAPRADIGMYLSDIHDHVVTMSGNLTHYESLLSRAHSNYVAQINIRMNERAEQNADVLGKLTVLGTIVLPMNIITGMWGMNVWVPGQEYEGDLTWFWSITAGLVLFGITCYFIAKRVYGIV